MPISIAEVLQLPHGDQWYTVAAIVVQIAIVSSVIGAASLAYSRVLGRRGLSTSRIILIAVAYLAIGRFATLDSRVLRSEFAVSAITNVVDRHETRLEVLEGNYRWIGSQREEAQ